MNPYKTYLRALSAALIAGVPLAACNQQGSQPYSPAARFQDSSQQSDNPAQQQQDDGSGGGSRTGPTPQAGSGTFDDSNDGSGSSSGNSGSDSGSTSDEARAEEDTSATNYTATFKPVQNKTEAGSPRGNATFSVSRDQFTANVRATGLAPNQAQIQHIHARGRCPTAADDTNRDGWVDAVEAARVYGDILIPLDNDLTRQQEDASSPTPSPSATPARDTGPSPSPSPANPTEDNPDATNGTGGDGPANDTGEPTAAALYRYLQASPTPSPTANFPSSDASGNLNYSKSANLQAILADLRKPDTNPSDEYGKLGRGEPLALSRRVVEIHGVPPTTRLPSTVRSVMGLPAYMTLPVACGEIDIAQNNRTPSPTPSADRGPSPSPSPSPRPSASPSPSPRPSRSPFSPYGF